MRVSPDVLLRSPVLVLWNVHQSLALADAENLLSLRFRRRLIVPDSASVG